MFNRSPSFSACLLLLATLLPACFSMPQTPLVDGLGPQEDGLAVPESDSALRTDLATDATSGADWAIWFPDDERSPNRNGDAHSDAVPQLEGLTGDAGKPVAWNCHRTMEDLSDTVLTSSLLATGQQLAENDFLLVYDFLCGLESTNVSNERAFLFNVDVPSGLAVTVKCQKDCYAYLMKDGCLYSSIEGCWLGEDGMVRFAADLLPGLYVVGVEYIYSDIRPLEESATFDIHVALNDSEGQLDCATASVSNDSAAQSDCTELVQAGSKLLSADGVLDWGDGDDFFLGCSQFGVQADDIGGMPDTAHAYVADFEGTGPRTVDVSVSFGGAQPEAGLDYILAITTSPCGAAGAVIDCAWGNGPALSIAGITVFPHETLYAVIDGVGANAFEFESVSYDLVWSITEICE